MKNLVPIRYYLSPTRLRRLFLFFFFLAASFFLFTPTTHAATISAGGMGTSLIINDKDAKDGDIISYRNGKYILSDTPYDQSIVGVITATPAFAVIDQTTSGASLIVSSGKVYVLVSTKNGVIKSGDPITTSNNKGVGQKATEAGYIIGAALEDFSDKNPGKILVEFNPAFGKNQTTTTVKENLLTTLQLGAAAAALSPLGALRFILAAIIAIISFVFGFLFFGRISSRGVEAVGRNPLASKKILTSVFLNVIITVVIIGAGVAIAYLILVL